MLSESGLLVPSSLRGCVLATLQSTNGPRRRWTCDSVSGAGLSRGVVSAHETAHDETRELPVVLHRRMRMTTLFVRFCEYRKYRRTGGDVAFIEVALAAG